MRFKKIINSLFLKFYKVKLKNVVIDHNRYLGKSKNPVSIYDKPPRNMILSPFNISFEAMDRLLLINFEEDLLYYGIELQVLHKADKFYPVVIMYRKDNLIDLYSTNEIVILEKKKIMTDLLNQTSFNLLETIDYSIKVGEKGLNAYLFLSDKMENKIEIKIKENTPDRKLTAIITPLSAVNKKPQSFPIVYLDKFNMVIRKDTEIFVKINENLRKPAEFPIKIDNRNFYNARYSLDPINCNWNRFHSGNLNPILLDTVNNDIIKENILYKSFNNDGYLEIKKIIGVDELKHSVSFEFSPAIPNLISLKSGMKTKGKFSVIIGKKKGIFAGVYHIARKKEHITISIHPTKGWQPFPGKLWLKTYKWTANIEILDDFEFKLHSNWARLQ
jgi:hypothetical protein